MIGDDDRANVAMCLYRAALQLTFLQEHFRKDRTAQIWRIPGMIALVIMLIVALVPTGHYAWYNDDMVERDRPTPYDYAIRF